jgi:putative oxidoreductase
VTTAAFRKFAPLIARILLAQLFLVSGFGKVMAFSRTAEMMAAKGLPMSDALLVLTIALELGGGAMLVIGWRARWVAAALLAFTFVAGVIFHNFWSSPPAQMAGQLNNFMKNLSIMGGLLYVMVYGAGPLALDREQATPPPTPGRSHAGKES